MVSTQPGPRLLHLFGPRLVSIRVSEKALDSQGVGDKLISTSMSLSELELLATFRMNIHVCVVGLLGRSGQQD